MPKCRGLTLVEIMVMIVILMVLAGLILPTLRGSRVNSKRTACANNLNQIGKGLFMYADVPANRIFPTSGTTADPYADPTPMSSLNLLYRGYIADAKVFSCPSKPVAGAALQAVVPTVDGKLPASGPFLSAASCSYGYDPGHSPNDSTAALAADRRLGNANSDNHGPNAGQNVLTGAGTVEFRDSPVHPLGNENGKPIQDDDIYSLSPEPKITRDMDAFIRQ